MRPATLIAAVACGAVAAASLLIPSAPTTDPWGWIVWGREVVHLELSTAIRGAPSWKPLPVLFTAPLSLLGGAAPQLWILIARAAGLLGLLAAYRLGSRLGGRSAGVVAAAGVLLSAHWVRAFMHGYTEPLAIWLLLLAVERHLAGRPRQVLLLGTGVALARPEAFPLLVVYGIHSWRRRQLPLPALGALAIAMPALWIVPDWIGSGDPFHAGKVSNAVEPNGLHAAFVALTGAATIAPLPLSLTALAGLVIARRLDDRATLGLAAVALGWAGLLLGLMMAGYPATPRFFVLPAALVCVLGAVGAVRVVKLTATENRRVRVAALVALAVLPSLAVRLERTGAEARDAVRRARVESALGRAIGQVGPARLRACGAAVLPRGLGWVRGEVAWRLGLPLRRVRSVGTTGEDYLADLSRFGTGARPRRVTVRTRRRRIVLLDPFGGTRLRLSPSRVDLDQATRSGTWRLLLPDLAGCRVSPTRRAA